MKFDAKKAWEQKMNVELPKVTKTLEELGYSLAEVQPNLIGEKFLMKTSKFVLIGVRTSDKKKVIIKITHEREGKKELKKEREATENLKNLTLVRDSIKIASELYYGVHNGYLILINEFLEQDEVFVRLPIEEQFFLSLRAFSILESFYIATHEHERHVKKRFPFLTARKYLRRFKGYKKSILKALNNPEVEETLDRAYKTFKKNLPIVEKFSTYMVHEDFVPHNFRIQDDMLYFIDHEAILFGNKHETWARFINFMTLHNPRLESKLLEYVAEKGKEEYTSLRMMQALKCTQLIEYYASSLEKCKGDVFELTKKRIFFWKTALEHILDDTQLHESIVKEFRGDRDSLRTQDEIERQRLLKNTDI